MILSKIKTMLVFLVATKTPNGSRPSTEYFITLDMVKQADDQYDEKLRGLTVRTR